MFGEPLLLQETGPITDPVSFVQYGILGLVLLALIGGYLWTKPAVEAIQKVSEERRVTIREWEEDLIPLLQEIKSATQQASNASTSSSAELKRLADLLQYQTQALERLIRQIENSSRA